MLANLLYRNPQSQKPERQKSKICNSGRCQYIYINRILNIYIYIYVDICSSRRGDGSQDFVKFNYSPSPERKKIAKGGFYFPFSQLMAGRTPVLTIPLKKNLFLPTKRKK